MVLMMIAVTGCGGGEQKASQPLADLAGEYWQAHLVASPVTATSMGDRRYDSRLNDITPEGRATRVAELQGFLELTLPMLPTKQLF